MSLTNLGAASEQTFLLLIQTTVPLVQLCQTLATLIVFWYMNQLPLGLT